MIDFHLGRYALGVCVATAMLAGCGGTQPPIAATGANVAHVRQASSSGNDLLYIRVGRYLVEILTYPGLSHVQDFGVQGAQGGFCSDSGGDVFITGYDYNHGAGYIDEYAHGGTTPIATLHEEATFPNYCSVDPTAGTLAVANGQSNVAIFHAAKGRPKYYRVSGFQKYGALAYDGQGNLFITGSNIQARKKELAELPKGSSRFTSITMKNVPSITGLQWDGKYLAFLVHRNAYATVDRVDVSGSTGKVVGVTRFEGTEQESGGRCECAFWIEGGDVVLPAGWSKRLGNNQQLDVWNYPAGGNPVTAVTLAGRWIFGGLTVSVAPSGPRIHR